MSSRHWFIARMKEHLERQQFSRLLNEDLFSKRVEYDLDSQEVRFIAGPEPDPEHSPYERLGRQLFDLHEASLGFSHTGHHSWVLFGKWPEHWAKRLRQAENYRDFLFKSGVVTPFEEIFVQNYTYFAQLAQVALFYLEDHEYDQVVRECKSFGILAYRNFSWNDVEEDRSGFRFINPENWVLDIPLRDLGQFIKNSSIETLSLDGALQFLDGYQHKRSLSPEEFHMIYSVMLYPGKFMKLVDEYFTQAPESERDWTLEIRSLVERYEQWEPVLAAFPDEIRRQFGIEITPIEWLKTPAR